ncbi:hypothetical protein BJX63DRAFT_175935 [Aspergillus granulosus]|uniref:Uncharacterized protein n=1 Tax=Aspergillus granulosus TaxID=176169 RepID=A0ABR4I517_9EURO
MVTMTLLCRSFTFRASMATGDSLSTVATEIGDMVEVNLMWVGSTVRRRMLRVDHLKLHGSRTGTRAGGWCENVVAGICGHGTSGLLAPRPAGGRSNKREFGSILVCDISAAAARNIPANHQLQAGKVDVEGCDVMDELAAGSPMDGRPGDPR